jgi:energy-coupling factor transporter ATP-binding protein EcfA2
MTRHHREVVSEIFKSVGQPTVTYVKRDNAKFESTLKNALQTGGQICLITGPSKTGKTTLYRSVLAELKKTALTVRCDESLSPTEFWARALESIDFSRLKELQESGELQIKSQAKISGTIGWGWLASLMGEASLEVGGGASDTEIRERILARPSPFHIIPLLKKLPVYLVVEDYHYLTRETQRVIFQQWKSFVDEEISVIILGTTHRAIDIINANRDLLARVCHIEVSRWEERDLQSIISQGFDYLELPISAELKRTIAEESVGIPILVQQACQQLFADKDIFEHEEGAPVSMDRNDVEHSLRNLAKTKYSQLESSYSRLITGPRKGARRYDTYEHILSCFAQEPIKFSLRRHEIDERLLKIHIPASRRPPAASINSTLKALGRFQSRADIKLLEWRGDENVLYMLEPLFLFFLRWRETPRARPYAWISRMILDTKLFESVQGALFGSLTEKSKALQTALERASAKNSSQKKDS